jgi:hypothetical protein
MAMLRLISRQDCVACHAHAGDMQRCWLLPTKEQREGACSCRGIDVSPVCMPENSAMGVVMRCRGYSGGVLLPYTRQLQRRGASQAPQHHPPQSYFYDCMPCF